MMLGGHVLPALCTMQPGQGAAARVASLADGVARNPVHAPGRISPPMMRTHKHSRALPLVDPSAAPLAVALQVQQQQTAPRSAFD